MRVSRSRARGLPRSTSKGAMKDLLALVGLFKRIGCWLHCTHDLCLRALRASPVPFCLLPLAIVCPFSTIRDSDLFLLGRDPVQIPSTATNRGQGCV